MSTTETSPVYKYADQLDQSSFRLLKFDSKRDDDFGNLIISCQIQTFERISSPKYVALSYAWNEPLSASNDYDPLIVLNGCQTYVSPNLYEGLRQLIHGESVHETEYWWIDALCINQRNPEEQGDQVSIMHRIFHDAVTVIVWLGADFTNEAYEVREFLRALLAQYVDEDMEQEGKDKYSPGFLRYADTYVSSGLPDASHPIWKRVVDFWDRAWFSRMWVAQEVAVAQSIEIYCGHIHLTVRELILASRFHVFSGLGEGLMLLRDGLDLLKSVAGRRVGCSAVKIDDLQMYANGIPFAEAIDYREAADRLTGPMAIENHPCLRLFAVQLFLSRRDKATDPKDKVFTLLVFMKQVCESYGVDEVGLEVDYSKPFFEVYQEATAWIILQSGCLGILSLMSPARTLSNCPGECSWIPDFNEEPVNVLRVFGSPDPRIVTKVPGPELCPAIHEYNLYLSAKYHSTVADIGDSFKSMIDDGCYELSARVVLNCPLVMAKHNNLPRIEVWRRTLAGQSAYSTDVDPQKSRADFHYWFAFYTLRAMDHAKLRGSIKRYRELIARMPSFELLAETDMLEPRVLPRWAFWEDVTTVNVQRAIAILQHAPQNHLIEISGRRLFSMKSSDGVYLGYGPEVMEEGDEVWFAAGAALPLVLRPLAQEQEGMRSYAFVGEAYMIDIEDMVQELQSSGWQRVNIK